MNKLSLVLITSIFFSMLFVAIGFSQTCGQNGCEVGEDVWTCCQDCGVPPGGCDPGNVKFWYICPTFAGSPIPMSTDCDNDDGTVHSECGIEDWSCDSGDCSVLSIKPDESFCPDYCHPTLPEITLNGYCDSTEDFTCDWLAQNCTVNSGKYCVGNSLETRNYICSQATGSCDYSVSGQQDCGQSSWSDGGDTLGYGNDPACIFTQRSCVDSDLNDYCDVSVTQTEDFDSYDNPFQCFGYNSGKVDYWCDLATCDSVTPNNGCSPGSLDYPNGCDLTCGAECSLDSQCGTDQWVCLDDDTRAYRDYECSLCSCEQTDINQEDCQQDYTETAVNYCEGNLSKSHQRFHDFYCGSGSCLEQQSWMNDSIIQDCDIQDGWYNVGNPYQQANMLCQDREYRDYTCSVSTICQYIVTDTDSECHEYGYPGDQVPRICVKHRDVIIGTDANPPGINPFDYRTGLYAFTGEQLEFTIVVRDPNGALDIGFAKIRVGTQAEVICNPATLPSTCDGMDVLSDTTDKAFHCLLTVEPQWYGEEDVKITAYNSANNATDGTHVETWFFNPVLSLSVATSDGQAINFEQMPYMADTPAERTVHSLNRLVIQNTAEGGVNMWMFLAGTDLYDPSGASKCPTSNVLAIEQMKYRGWTGTMWTSSEGWETMSKYDQNDDCVMPLLLGKVSHCYGGLPVPYPNTVSIPNPLENVLTNQGKLQVEFKLTYPMPCIGIFSQGSLLVFGKAI